MTKLSLLGEKYSHDIKKLSLGELFSVNAIATVVSTKVLSPRHAVLFGAGLEFIGALTGTHVAKTIGAGIVNSDMITLTVIFCALLAAVLWNLLTWYLGLPSSSSRIINIFKKHFCRIKISKLIFKSKINTA